MDISKNRRNEETVVMQERIKKAALRLFLREGIEKVTMRRIASKIKYSPATIYNYYKNKHAIFLALRQDGFARFRSYQENSRSSRSARKRIHAHGRAYLQFALENPKLYELMFIIKAPMGEIVSDTDRLKTSQSFLYLKDDIEACMSEGLIRRGNSDVVALAFWSVGHGLASLLIRQRLTMFESSDQAQTVVKAADYLYTTLVSSNKIH